VLDHLPLNSHGAVAIAFGNCGLEL